MKIERNGKNIEIPVFINIFVEMNIDAILTQNAEFLIIFQKFLKKFLKN